MFLKKNKLPTILIVDSGVGGLSIFYQIKKIIPNANYLYVFDNEAFPYGEKTKRFIINRLIIIINAVRKLHYVDLIIIACNTASILALKALRQYFFYPIIGVLPAIKLATTITNSKVIGLLATTATINSKYITNSINNYKKSYKIISLKAPELVNLVEAKLHGEKISLLSLREILFPWLKTSQTYKLDTIILGCTHFPLIYEELKLILPTSIKIIDAHQTVANRVFLLSKKFINSNQSSIFTINKTYCPIINNKI
ncbi:MAG: glutamate racemase, partial [Candidatus Baumannia cicadellinicola]|nr:glutamate racemase [Candidatus Baumannia cicadellinicola]